MTISLEQALIILEHRQQQMLAFQQQLIETVLDKFFNDGAKMAVPEERQVEGSIPFISDGKCKIGKLAGSEQDNILPNAHETVTVSDEQEKEGSADNPLSPESNETPLSPPISDDKLTSEQNYSLRDIGQENWKNACPENNWNNTVNQIVPNVIRNHGETEVYNMGSRNDPHNSDEISYKDEKSKPVESDDDQKSDAILLDADSPSYQISSSENLNEFDGDVSEKPNSDDLKSNIVHHHLFISSGFCIQYEKCVLNKVILIVNWRYEDPTLFRGGGNVGEFQPTDNFLKSESNLRIFKKRGGVRSAYNKL
uniref:Smp_200060 n=1 Tax=Schistosoma mansoni TaxID=6183 RepID=A0A3Q0KUW3_SCHMA